MPVTVLVGAQWGDEGKGKGIDLLAAEANIVARYQGGPNAGHTIVAGEQKIVLHQLPSGALHEHVTCVLGGGMVIDPVALVQEIDKLEALGVSIRPRLLIAPNAHIITPLHRESDQASIECQNIGTTKKGIGFAYKDKAGREGLRAADLLGAKECLLEKTSRLSEDWEAFFTACEELKPLVRDTTRFLHEALLGQKTILAEGAQGILLDIDHGTYPFVTSSNTGVGGAINGLGIPASAINRVIGVAKAYTTRVGNGPFPTEQEGPDGERLQKRGHEVGATTGRKRRCGWIDIPLIRYGAQLNGYTELWLTKLDVLDGFQYLPCVVQYTLESGAETTASTMMHDLGNVVPQYHKLLGWRQDTSTTRALSDLPTPAQEYLRFVQQAIGVPITLVGVGPDREQCIICPDGIS
jgi:adenylosuccinate synthase